MIKSRRMSWAGYVARMGEKRNVGKAKGKIPLGRPRRRWAGNIKMDFRQRGWGCIYWIYLAEDKDQWRVLVRTVMNFQIL
jgi:hypothetical protein